MTGILFDLDGTLLDTLDDLMDAVNHTLAQFGYPQRTREEIRRFVGNGAGNLLRRAALLQILHIQLTHGMESIAGQTFSLLGKNNLNFSV